MKASKEHKPQQSRVIATKKRNSKQFKKSGNIIQKVSIANNTINCPSWGDRLALGTTIHGHIIANYLNWGYVGNGNRRVSGNLVNNNHRPDLEVVDNLNNIIRFGEIKPSGQEDAGRNQINAVSNDQANNLTLNDQVNVVAWANQVAIPIRDIDPRGNTNNAQDVIHIRQDRARRGLYVYNGN